METKNLPAQKLTLGDVQEQFETWRRKRSKKGRIPPRLWKAAVRLSETHTLSELSTALRVNYSDLRKQVIAHQPPVISDPACNFVEVDVSRNNQSTHYTIELEDRFGSRMKVSCSGRSEVDLLELIKVFWCK